MQNLVLAPILVHKVSKLEAEKRATELLGRFGLSEKANQYPELLIGVLVFEFIDLGFSIVLTA